VPVSERVKGMFNIENRRAISEQDGEEEDLGYNEQYIKIAHLTDAHIQPIYSTVSV